MFHQKPAARGVQTLAPLAALFFASQAALAQNGLDRGHSILLEKGLQIQAQAFPRVEDSHRVVGFSLSRWAQSNFTTINWHANLDAAQYLGTAPGIPWGRYAIAWNDPLLRQSELPFLSKMVSYQYKDEQDLGNAIELEEARKTLATIRQRYPGVLSYTNQWGSELSVSTMQNYMSVAKPDMVMFDTYPFSGSSIGSTRSPKTYYDHLQKYRNLGLAGHNGTGAAPIPYGLYTQTFVVGGHSVSDFEMRLNQFSAWALGYTFASAFTYAHELDNDLDPVLFSGLGDSTPTTRFYKMAETNGQSRKLGPSLVRLKSTDVRMVQGQYRNGSGTSTNPLPSGISAWNGTSDPYITGITATNLGTQNDGRRDDVIIGYFKPLVESFDGPTYENQTYFMLVNGLIDPTYNADVRQNIRLNFNFGTSGINSLQRLDRTTGQVQTVPLVNDGGAVFHLDWVMDGGMGDLFKFNTGAMFVPGPGWATNGSGDWNVAGNWLSGVVPNGVGSTAEFTGIISSNKTVYTDAAVTAGTIRFENVNTYTLTGAGTLTLQSIGSSSSLVDVKMGTHKIFLPLVIASNTTINVASGATLKISNPVTINSGKSVTHSGAGEVVYQSTITVQPAASVAFANSTFVDVLALGGDARASLLPHTGDTPAQLELNLLTMDADTTLDVTNNAILLRSTSSSVRSQILSGKLFSSTATATQNLGYDVVAEDRVRVVYTLLGDADLDLQVTSTDFNSFIAGYRITAAVDWSAGDFNFDGRVNTLDFNSLAGNFGVMIENTASIGSTVPEPASAFLVALLSCSCLSRRRGR